MIERPASWAQLMQATAAVASLTQSSCLHLAARHALGEQSHIDSGVKALQHAQLDTLYQSLHFAKNLAQRAAPAGTGGVAASSTAVAEMAPEPRDSKPHTVSSHTVASQSGCTSQSLPSHSEGSRPNPAEDQRAHVWSFIAQCLCAAHWMQQAAPELVFSAPGYQTTKYVSNVLKSLEGEEGCRLLMQQSHGGTPHDVLPAGAPGGVAGERSCAADERAMGHSPSHPALEAVQAALDVLVSSASQSFAPLDTSGAALGDTIPQAMRHGSPQVPCDTTQLVDQPHSLLMAELFLGTSMHLSGISMHL